MATPVRKSDMEVIDAIGVKTLMDAGYSAEVIRKWRKRGIAWPARGRVQMLARDLGKKLPPNFATERA